mmetsp:Transcript_4207/g.11137  ORF Transcript_4207/g.11137 Transcript_4207/m.11137 type:complete len:126 (-) Transcript_4207:252-629(-)
MRGRLDAFNILFGSLSGSFVLQEIFGLDGYIIAVFTCSVLIILLGLVTLLVYWPAALGRKLGFDLGSSEDITCDCCAGERKKSKQGEALLSKEELQREAAELQKQAAEAEKEIRDCWKCDWGVRP